jgi:hypothetical protein
LLAHGWWFSPGTPASSTTNTGHHDAAEILLKVALSTKIQIQIHRIGKPSHVKYLGASKRKGLNMITKDQIRLSVSMEKLNKKVNNNII